MIISNHYIIQTIEIIDNTYKTIDIKIMKEIHDEDWYISIIIEWDIIQNLRIIWWWIKYSKHSYNSLLSKSLIHIISQYTEIIYII